MLWGLEPRRNFGQSLVMRILIRDTSSPVDGTLNNGEIQPEEYTFQDWLGRYILLKLPILKFPVCREFGLNWRTGVRYEDTPD